MRRPSLQSLLSVLNALALIRAPRLWAPHVTVLSQLWRAGSLFQGIYVVCRLRIGKVNERFSSVGDDTIY